ncbi:hypothetical protein [Nostoc sp. CCY0012]
MTKIRGWLRKSWYPQKISDRMVSMHGRYLSNFATLLTSGEG